MIMLRFPALPLYTRGRTIDEQTVLMALYSLWHNSLIRISTFREFRSQQFHEGHNLFANYQDEDVPAMFEATF